MNPLSRVSFEPAEMEKYRQFSDETKGVNPFVPLWVNNKLSGAQTAFRYLVLYPFVMPIRCLLLMFGVTWLLLSWVLITPVAAIFGLLGPAERGADFLLLQPVTRFLFFVGCRCCLYALGFLWIDYGSYVPAQRLKMRVNGKKPEKAADNPGLRLLLCNSQSTIDILYLGLFGYNKFVFAVEGRLTHCFGLIPALLSRSGKIDPPPPRRTINLKNEIGDVVIFPEPGKTNGTCILPLEGLPADFAAWAPAVSAGQIGCVTLQYPSNSWNAYGTTQTIHDGIWGHLLKVMKEPRHCVTSVWLSSTLVGLNLAPGGPFRNTVRGWLATMPSPVLHEVNVRGTELKPFFLYWRETQSKKYSPQKKD